MANAGGNTSIHSRNGFKSKHRPWYVFFLLTRTVLLMAFNVRRQKIRENAESTIFSANLAKSGNSDAKDRRAIRNSMSTNQKTGAQPGALSQPIRSQ